MNNKKVIKYAKILTFAATIGLSFLSKWIDSVEQKEEIQKAVSKYMKENINE